MILAYAGTPPTMSTALVRGPLLRKLLEGERTWGGLAISTSRGAATYRLVMYPPGLDRNERIALRLWRGFSVWGLGLWLLVQAPLMATGETGLALAVATGTYLAAGAVVMAGAGSSRREVRTVTVTRTGDGDDAEYDALRSLAERLVSVDNRLAAGDLSAVRYEAEMWRVYDAM